MIRLILGATENIHIINPQIPFCRCAYCRTAGHTSIAMDKQNVCRISPSINEADNTLGMVFIKRIRANHDIIEK